MILTLDSNHMNEFLIFRKTLISSASYVQTYMKNIKMSCIKCYDAFALTEDDKKRKSFCLNKKHFMTDFFTLNLNP